MWQGRRFKSPDYHDYELEVGILLPKAPKTPLEGPLEVSYTFYLKNHKATDYDNLIKPLQDILVKNGFISDDRHIYRATILKVASKVDRVEVLITQLQIKKEGPQ